jgi:hypothetical protein
VIADDAVVRDVRVCHEEAIRSHASDPGGRGTAVEGTEFPDPGAFTDLQARGFSGVLQILRIGAEHGSLCNSATRADSCIALDYGMGPYPDIGAELDARTDHRERTELDARMQYGIRVHGCRGIR